MCNFCHRHGDGRKWYLEARNYAADLARDLRRRQFIRSFAVDFDESARAAVAGMERLQRLPGPLRTLASRLATRRMMREHFGQPVPLEDCVRIFQITTSIVRIPCVCRRFSRAPDDAYCLAITTFPADDAIRQAFADYAAGPDTGAFQRLTAEQALEFLRSCEQQGMMHSVWTFITPFIAGLCNCRLSDGCLAMRATLEYGIKVMWKGEYVARCDPDLCVGCRQCVALCPFAAMAYDGTNRKAWVRADLCYGCGICRTACNQDAIRLADRAAVPTVASNW